jgi:hypothetical protein
LELIIVTEPVVVVLAGLLLPDAGQDRTPFKAQAVEPRVGQDALHQVSLLLHPFRHTLGQHTHINTYSFI